MTGPKFLKPSEMKRREERSTVSARIKTVTAETLERLSSKEDLTMSQLIANILDQYVEWIEDSKRKAK